MSPLERRSVAALLAALLVVGPLTSVGALAAAGPVTGRAAPTALTDAPDAADCCTPSVPCDDGACLATTGCTSAVGLIAAIEAPAWPSRSSRAPARPQRSPTGADPGPPGPPPRA